MHHEGNQGHFLLSCPVKTGVRGQDQLHTGYSGSVSCLKAFLPAKFGPASFSRRMTLSTRLTHGGLKYLVIG